MVKPINFHGLLVLKLTSVIFAILLSSTFLLAQNSPKKVKNKPTATKKVEVKDKAIPSHRHVVKGKQKKHSKYQGDIETNN